MCLGWRGKSWIVSLWALTQMVDVCTNCWCHLLVESLNYRLSVQGHLHGICKSKTHMSYSYSVSFGLIFLCIWIPQFFPARLNKVTSSGMRTGLESLLSDLYRFSESTVTVKPDIKPLKYPSNQAQFAQQCCIYEWMSLYPLVFLCLFGI